MNSMQEVVGLLYVALAIAAGGNDLLEDSNDILRTVIKSGSLSPDALSLKVGDGGNREGGISWGCLTPPLLHRRSDMPCPKITSSS